ncbi:hypothetical protein ACI4B7_27035, partial [Klebsiella pneumoniae]|uniref:hypothetical protein n=2 Tax=Bacteria TaxID=2 RepID=UPI003852AC43
RNVNPPAARAPECERGGQPLAGCRVSGNSKEPPMNIFLIIIIVAAIVIAIVSGLSQAASFLLWIAIIVGLIALIVLLFRLISGRKPV